MKANSLCLVSLMVVLQWFFIGTAAAKTINVAYPSPSWNTSLPVSTAKEFGLFAAEGLLSGAVDAVILPNVPQSFRSGDPRIQRVFADCRSAIRNYFQATGIFPITHTLVTHERMIFQHPWLCREIVAAFSEADRRSRLEYEYPKRFSFPTAVLFLEEEEQQFGKNPWIHGLEPNRAVLKKFVQYAREQEYISFEPPLDDLFAPVE